MSTTEIGYNENHNFGLNIGPAAAVPVGQVPAPMSYLPATSEQILCPDIVIQLYTYLRNGRHHVEEIQRCLRSTAASSVALIGLQGQANK